MQILSFPLGELQANCYLLINGKDCLIIDPGDSAEFILEEIQRRNVEVVGIFATHGHFDHIMAAGELQLSLESLYQKQMPVYINKKDRFLVDRLVSTAKHFLGHTPIVMPIRHFSDLDIGKNAVGSFTFDVLETPGHTPGSNSFYFEDGSVLFSGDTLFMGAVGSYEHSYSDKNKLITSVKHLLELPEETVIYPGHGESSLIQLERKMNYFE